MYVGTSETTYELEQTRQSENKKPKHNQKTPRGISRDNKSRLVNIGIFHKTIRKKMHSQFKKNRVSLVRTVVLGDERRVYTIFTRTQSPESNEFHFSLRVFRPLLVLTIHC